MICCFVCSSTNQKWAGDITYLRTGSGWIYLAAVMDLYNREVVGYSVSKTIDTKQAASPKEQPYIGWNFALNKDGWVILRAIAVVSFIQQICDQKGACEQFEAIFKKNY